MASGIEVFTAVAAAVAAIGSITQGIARGIEAWRNRAGLKVSCSFNSQAFDRHKDTTLDLLSNFGIKATLTGRYPITVTSAGIDLRGDGFHFGLPWRRRFYRSVPVINGLDGIGRPFPALLNSEHPEVTAFETLSKLQATLSKKEHGSPFQVWVAIPGGRRTQKLKASTIAILTTTPADPE